MKEIQRESRELNFETFDFQQAYDRIESKTAFHGNSRIENK